jgi:serine phosphatase RsbU (regulator of sigma subunit)
LEAELARAAEVQTLLLPRGAPALPGYAWAAACLPAREVGGDFYDWQMQPDGTLSLTLGDVMGKGMPAALLMATVRAALRAATHHSVASMVEAVNRVLSPDLEESESFITLFHANLDPDSGLVTYVDAGHGLAFLLQQNGTAIPIGPGGLPLGIFASTGYHQTQTTLDPGATFVLYSDGLPDARPDLALDPVAIAAHLHGMTDVDAMLATLVALTAGADPRPDDVTLVLIRRDSDRK